jgi:hypothetical protein
MQQAWNVRVTQRTFGNWDLQGAGGRALQDYSPSNTFALRRDYLDRIGGGIGYSFAKQVRLSLDVAVVNRRSQLPSNRYQGVTSGFSMIYGH